MNYIRDQVPPNFPYYFFFQYLIQECYHTETSRSPMFQHFKELIYKFIISVNLQICIMDSVDFNQSVEEAVTGMAGFNSSNIAFGFGRENNYIPRIRTLAVPSVSVMFVLSIINIVVNILNVLVTCNKRFEFPISSRVAIVSMSMADLIIGIAVAINILCIRWRKYYCHFYLLVTVTCFRVSIVSLVIVLVDRYIAIAFPFRHQRHATKKVSIALVLLSWLSVATANVIEFLVTGNYYYDQRRSICQIVVPAVRSIIISISIECFLPLTTIIVIYARLLTIVRSLIRGMAQVYPLNSISAPSTSDHTPPDERSDRNHYTMMKTIVTFLAVTLAFTFINIPIRILRLVVHVRGGQAVSQSAVIFSRVIVMTSSFWNFVIFSLVNQNFRHVLKEMFRCKCRSTIRN